MNAPAPGPRGASRARFLAMAAATAWLSACAPVVMHGPRVQPGVSGGITMTRGSGEIFEGARTECDHVCPHTLIAPLGTSLRYGWAADAGGGPGFHVGVQVPLIVVSPYWELDAYVQLPGPVPYGAGLLFSADHATPYAQVGIERGERRTWYTTQAVALFGGLNGGSYTDPRLVTWLPSLVWQEGVGERVLLHVQAIGGVQLHISAEEAEAAGTDSGDFFMVGITVQVY